jgi:DHA2 family multidrug resistance protein
VTVAKPATNPWLGIAGVFLGAAIATMNGRLLSVGLPDLRGAAGFGFDEASWLPTALNMATMFSGCFVIFLSALFGPRRMLLPASIVFALVSAVLPLAHDFRLMTALIIIAGLASGTFYSLTMTFVLTSLPKRLVIFGIAAYAAEIVFSANIASALEGWYVDHLSWRWIFWFAAVSTPLMTLCVYFGIPRVGLPELRPSWRGFTYFSLGVALIYGALDQGERLYWLNSGVIVAMLAAGIFLVIASALRRMIQPLPILDLSFLNTRNIIISALAVFVFKFVQLSTLVLVPGFLANVRQYLPVQTGAALAWVALPMFAVVWLVAIVVIYTDSRLTLALGLAIVAAGCWRYSQIDSSWAGNSFEMWDMVVSVGFACSYVGLVGNLVLEAIQAGATTAVARAATFSGFVHFVRLFGGEAGTVLMTHFVAAREKFHSNLLGLHVQTGSWLTAHRIQQLTGGMFSVSSGTEEARDRAVGILSLQVRAQAYTLATADGFRLVEWIIVLYLLMMLFLRPASISYKDLRKMS